MLTFYYSLAPNPMKVPLFLEEAGLPYDAVPVDTRKGEQHAPAFTALNPNAKVPVIVDGATTVFDSNAILLYLAETSGQFLPAAADRGAMLSWLMFIALGIGPRWTTLPGWRCSPTWRAPLADSQAWIASMGRRANA